VNSLATKHTLLSSAKWLNPDKIKVIYHGIDTMTFNNKGKSIRKELNISDDEPVIGFVGRLNVQKGIVYMMDAFKLVKEKIPSAHLVIAGTGDLKDEIEKKSFEYGYSNSIHMLGFREDIPDILNSIDLLLLPSLWEGFGLVLIEAMAAGKPCVTTRISSMPEIVDDAVSGFIVPPKEPEALADACCKLLTNPQLAENMGKEGKRIVNEKFTLRKMINAYENLFIELVN
jgi:glycosyltransferase involved in cell wall biosynthesis